MAVCQCFGQTSSAWGHPEVYIVILPAFGMYSEIIPTFCKRLFGHQSMIWATAGIAF